MSSEHDARDELLRSTIVSRDSLLRRAILVPPDLRVDVERLAQADGFESLQSWAIFTFQRLVNERPEIADPHARVPLPKIPPNR